MKKRLLIGLFLVMALVFGAMTPYVGAQGGALTLYGTISGKYLVKVDPDTGQAFHPGTGVAGQGILLTSTPLILVSDIAFNPSDNKLYGLAHYEGSLNPILTTIDQCTGEVTVIGLITLPNRTVYFAEGLAINANDGTIYVSMSINDPQSNVADYSSETLATVDAATAEATYVATITQPSAYTTNEEADALEFVGSTLYAADDPGTGPSRIFTISTTTGVSTYKGELSDPRFNNISDMACNPESNLLYGFDPGGQSNIYSRYLCTISQPDTAIASPIGPTHTTADFDGGKMQGLAWAPAPVCPGLTGCCDLVNTINVAIGLIEAKLDGLGRLPGAVNAIEAKNDKIEAKLDGLGRLPGAVNAIETKNDKIETKLDRLGKLPEAVSKIEAKNDKMEAKLDGLGRLPGAVSKIEAKNDKMEAKLDNLTKEITNVKTMLKQLSAAIGMLEAKLDKPNK